MENLLRTYTDQELNALFEKTGFPEISKQYCIEKYNEKYIEFRKYDIKEEELQRGKEALLEYLKDECSWNANTLRERAWEVALEELKIEAYIQQRKLGQGHEWAKLFCNEMEEHDLREDDALIYSYTYQAFKELGELEELAFNSDGKFLSKKNNTLADQEFKRAVKTLSKDEGEIVERFIRDNLLKPYEGTIQYLFQEALEFRKFYNEIVAEGHTEEEALDYAYDLWNEEVDSTFSIVYKEAMKHHESHAKAYHLAQFCSTKDINGEWPHIKERDLRDFPELWQREIIAEFKIKDAGEGWPNYINEIRKSIGLNEI